MIYDTIDHLYRYQELHPNICRGLQFLAETDFSKLSSGRYEIDGDNVFAIIQNYDTKVADDILECHRKYIDIQYLINGVELVGVSRNGREENADAAYDNDVCFYHDAMDFIAIGNRRFLIIFPGEMHAPGIAVDNTMPVFKCVVKVYVPDYAQNESKMK